MTSLSPIWLSLSILVIAAANLNAIDRSAETADELKFKTERVIVFKDGYCLVVKEGTATTDKEGNVFTHDVPDSAILGSFWAIPEKGTIRSMVAGWDETKSTASKTINCLTIVEIVKANVGRECSFEIGDEQFEGKIIKLLSNDDQLQEIVTPTSPRALSQLSRDQRMSLLSSHRVENVTGQFFILGTDDGDVVISTSSVKNLTIADIASTREQTTHTKTIEKRLTLRFQKKNQPVKIKLMYFRPDVRWIPTYRIDLTEDDFANKSGKEKRKTAKISMQGEILNEAEDFIDVPFHVVVGVPNFRFKSVPSPMILETAVRSALVQAAPNIMGNGGQNFDMNQMSNALYTQRSGEFRSHRANGSNNQADVELPESMTSQSGNDLYVYQLEKMTLKKGERASVPILTTEVGYRDIYTWDVEITHSETYAASSADSPSPLVLTENKVWRQIELVNDTKIPWTTGAAMFVDGYQPLAQELLTYTSPGGICRVPITVSVDMRGKTQDAEVKRDLKALRWRGYDYARVEGKIEIELANNKEVAVPVEVRVRFGGKATKTSEDGKITLSAFRQEDWHNNRGDQINNSSLVEWTGKIEPGECFKPMVDYEFLMRH